MGFSPRTIKLREIFVVRATSSTKARISPKPMNPLETNTSTNSTMVKRIFIRASIRCTAELPGKYWPMVMFLSICIPCLSQLPQ